MGLFAWNDKYRVHIWQIDNQHQRLFDLVNQLHDAMQAGKGKEILGKVLQELITYTHTHFAAEENLMSKYEFPDFAEHKKTHDALIKQVVDFQQKFRNGNAFITLELMKILENWLITHIEGVDQSYGPFLIGKGVK
jgi:hemerythrin